MTKRNAPDWLTRHTYAHRGLHSDDVPENSLAAAQAAIAAGFGIECDVQMSADGVAMVFHDWELDRLTGQSGAFAARTAEELCQISLGQTGQRIWTLADLLELIDGQVPLLIEVKSQPDFAIEQACAAIAREIASYTGPLAVMSFDPRMGEWFAEHAPAHPRGLVTTDVLDLGFLSAWREPQAIERARPDFLACDIRDLPNAITDLWRGAGRPLLSWTVRSLELRERVRMHADAPIAEGEGIA